MIILAIARNAFLESIRQPVFVVLMVAGILALVLDVNLAAFTLDNDDKLLVDLGLSTLFLAGLLMAAFTATGVLTRELENRTVLTVVSKPVSRPAFVVGKYLGVAAALAVGFWTLAAVFLLAIRHGVPTGPGGEGTFDMPVLVVGLLSGGLATAGAALANYLYRRPFPSLLAAALMVAMTAAVGVVWCVDRGWRFQSPLVEWNPQLMTALVLVFEALLVLAAAAIAASTRLGQLPTILACVGLFLVGLVSEYFLGSVVAQPAGRSRWLVAACWPLYAAVPNLQFFWPADALSQGHDLTAGYLASVSLYAACMSLALIALAVLLFQERDVG
jgi:ABC-type multidrug transport system permease subunit